VRKTRVLLLAAKKTEKTPWKSHHSFSQKEKRRRRWRKGEEGGSTRKRGSTRSFDAEREGKRRVRSIGSKKKGQEGKQDRVS